MADQDQTDQQPTFWHGLMSGLQQAPANPLVNMGLGLMQAAAPFGNVGTSLMNANAATIQNRGAMQQQAIQSYGLARQKEMWPAYKAVADQITNRFTGGGNMSAGTSMAPPPAVPDNPYRPMPPLQPITANPGADIQLNAAAKFLGMPAPNPEPKDQQGALELQQKQRQQQISPSINVLKSVASAGNADQLIQNDPELSARYAELAPHMGLDPNPKTLIPENGRAFGALAHNLLQGSAGGTPMDMPKIYDVVPGPGGQNWIVERGGTGPPKVEGSQMLPDYDLVQGTDPATGAKTVTPVLRKPGGANAPLGAINAAQHGATPNTAPSAPGTVRRVPITSAVNAPRGGGVGQATAPTSVLNNYEKPSDTELKVATLANYARSNLPVMQQMEASGYRMSPTVRAAVINAATSDDPGKLSQWMSQEMLAHALSDKDLQYMAALMPFLQAAGHDMTGARLTTGQMRTNFESTIPVASNDPKYLSTVANNRQQLYAGLLAGSGNAALQPQFAKTLGADKLGMQQTNQLPVVIKSPADIAKLASGQHFITPDGRHLVNRPRNGQQ